MRTRDTNALAAGWYTIISGPGIQLAGFALQICEELVKVWHDSPAPYEHCAIRASNKHLHEIITTKHSVVLMTVT